MSIDDTIRLSNRRDKIVHNVLKTYQDHNEFMQPFTQPRGHKRLLNCDDLNYLEAILHAKPGLFLDELQEKLCIVQDIEVSISTLSHTLSCLAITHKSITKEAAKWDEYLCATWQIAMAQYDPQQPVFIDKAGVDGQTNFCKNGWAPLGQACMHDMSFL